MISYSVSNGQLPVDQCAPFRVTDLGVVRFDIPQVEHPTSARLELRLVSGENLIAITEQEFYVFPNPASRDERQACLFTGVSPHPRAFRP